VAKVDREDLLLEALNVKNGEMSAILVPADDIGIDLVLNLLEMYL
jgi:hypothetical protein